MHAQNELDHICPLCYSFFLHAPSHFPFLSTTQVVFFYYCFVGCFALLKNYVHLLYTMQCFYTCKLVECSNQAMQHVHHDYIFIILVVVFKIFFLSNFYVYNTLCIDYSHQVVY
jgi:hypothetical protein